MNQSNQQNNQNQQSNQSQKTIRQITQEEMQRELAGHNLTQEELQKTQVLNLKDVQEAAKMERFTSKKPAIILATFGVLLLFFGAGFQVVRGLHNSHNNEPVTQKRVVEKDNNLVAKVENLTCSTTSMNNSDGTDTVYTIIYQFKDDKLVGFTKTFDIKVTPNNPLGQQTVASYTNAYKAFMNSTNGYNITVTPTDTGLVTNVQVNYDLFDSTTLNPTQQTHFSTSVEYQKDTLKSVIETNMSTAGMVCK